MSEEIIEKVAKELEEAWLARGYGEGDQWNYLARAAVSAYNPNERLREALERIAKYDVGLQGLVEDGKDTPENVANYYAAQVERRRKIAREALSPLPQGED